MKLIFILLLLPFSNALAGGSGDGGWISSGGELFQDARNPWYVKNTQEVFWCLRVDSGVVSATENEIELAFNDAKDYWRSEASESRLASASFSIATQKFSRLDCSDNRVTLRIIFGRSLLNKEEADFLKDPDKYVGVTVRQSYDTKLLRASGFIYFSADQDPNNKKILPRAWSRPVILRYALKHELGHVFGIPHTGSGLMSEIFLDQIMKPEMVDLFVQLPEESFLVPKRKFDSCEQLSMPTKQFFSIPKEHDCIRVQAQGFDRSNFKLTSYLKTNPEQSKELGMLKMESPDIFKTFSAKPASFLQLPPGQEVFSEKEAGFRNFMVGPLMMEYSLKGKFTPATPGAPKAVYLHSSPTTWVLTGTVPSGDVLNLISYASPLGLLYLLPTEI